MMAQTNDLKTLRHWLRRPENCVASEAIALVSGIGIRQTLAELLPAESDALAEFARHMIDHGQTGTFKQIWMTTDGPVAGNAVPDGFAVELLDAIERKGDTESNGP